MADLSTRVARALQGATLRALDPEQRSAFVERVSEAMGAGFDALSPDDQALITAGEADVAAGRSDTLQDPSSWAAGSDWEAEDRAAGAAARAAAGTKSLDVDDVEWLGLGR